MQLISDGSRTALKAFLNLVVLFLAIAVGVSSTSLSASAARTGTTGSTQVAFSSPIAGSDVSGLVTISVSATTAAGVTVQEWCFTRDGSDINRLEPTSITVGGQPYTASSFSGCVLSAASDRSNASLTYNTAILSDGNHTFTARAYDSNGQLSNQASITFRTLNFQPLISTPTPTLQGTPYVGSPFSVNTGTWDTGVTFEYQWYSDGSVIPGATGSTFTPTDSHLGTLLSVSVTGKKVGYVSATRTSGYSAMVLSNSAIGGETPGTIISTFYGTYSGYYSYRSQIDIEYPAQLVCTTNSYCTIPIRYRYTKNVNSGWSFDFGLYDADTNERLDYFFTSVNSGWQTRNLNVYNLTKNRNLKFAFYNLGSGETGTVLRPGTMRFIGANTPEISNLNPVVAPYVVRNETTTVKAYNKFKVLQYNVPTNITLTTECITISAQVATYNLDSGEANDWGSTWGTNFVLNVKDNMGVSIKSFDIVGNMNEWSTEAPNKLLEIPVCGLSTKLGTSQRYSIDVSYSHSNFGISAAGSKTHYLDLVGGLKWTKINCYLGTDGVVIDAYKPVCPEGWKQTKAKVVNGKVTIKTINCLKTGTINVRTIIDPAPVCPAGFKVTSLPVKNGKLASTTITCVKGIVQKKITAIQPKCPSGYKKR